VTLLAALLFGASALPRADRGRLVLPAASISVEAPAGCAVLAVAEASKGPSYRFSQGKTPTREVEGLEGLFVEVSRLLAVEPTKPILIRADRRLAYRSVDEALEVLRRAGARRILLASEPSRRGAPPP
jgi:biopolymer transport protein ExbD